MNIGTGTVWTDYDNDGNLDLYLTNREAPNLMHHNNGDDTFTEMTTSYRDKHKPEQSKL